MDGLRDVGASHKRSRAARPTIRRPPSALVASALLAILLTVEALAPLPAASPVAVPFPPPAARPPAAVAAPDQARLAGLVLARPLFTHIRRPDAAPGTAGRTPSLPRLAGTVVGGGERERERFAILVGAGDDHPFVLREGASGHGLLVLAVAPGRVLAQTASGRVTLGLSAGGGPATVAAATLPPVMAAPPMTKDPRSREPNNQDE